MSIFADREIVTSSATIATMSVFFGCVSQFTNRSNPEYYLGYGLIGAGTLLLLLTLMAARHRVMLKVLRYLLGAILVTLLLGLLIGFERVPGLGPRGQFVSLIESASPIATTPA